MSYKIYKDSIGEIKVESDKLWGATTQRSFENFKIGNYKMPTEVIRAMATVKYACAMANYELGDLNKEKFSAIENAVEEIFSGKLDEHFPLVVFQTGSGTQTNMNLNEVIANYANQKAGKTLIHPNDDVNKSQSSNDTFPTALHIACLDVIDRKLIPSMKTLISALKMQIAILSKLVELIYKMLYLLRFLKSLAVIEILLKNVWNILNLLEKVF